MPPILLDTSVAIPLLDGDPEVLARAEALSTAPYNSILTAAEQAFGNGLLQIDLPFTRLVC